MLTDGPKERRDVRAEPMDADLCVVGGGLAGVCCAITAARGGLKVVLMQDRPVLGGNASSEVRLWALGATSHLNSNNRWSREGGVINEIMVENLYRNREGNPLIFDTVLMDQVLAEKNITLLLNTAVHDVRMAAPPRGDWSGGSGGGNVIEAVRGFNAQNATMYDVTAPLFCDASGDGIVGFLSGAAFRMGAEPFEAFQEKAAPGEDYGHLLGHSIYFYTKDTGTPVRFVPPGYAIDNVPGRIPRFHRFNAKAQGCSLWWIEYGGRLDTVHETEKIKYELWRVVYGVWDYIKNSGRFPEARTLTLEWAGTIPGKRESRRFEGDYILTQHDVVERRTHEDAAAYSGWAIDLHPADGVYSAYPGCTQWKFQGLVQIPYRCLYSRNVDNLLVSGRAISVSHVAFGTTRVMCTCAHVGQAAGMAAAICRRENLPPRALSTGEPLRQLQRELLRTGQHIPHLRLKDDADLAQDAAITASSALKLAELAGNGQTVDLSQSRAMLLPVAAGRMPKVTFYVDVAEPVDVRIELRMAERPDEFTPSVTRASRRVSFRAGEDQPLVFDFDVEIDQPRYVFCCVLANEHAKLRLSDQRVTGVLAVAHHMTSESQTDIGVERVEVWSAHRRPGGHNFACEIDPPLASFSAGQITNGLQRPTHQPNAWVAAPGGAGGEGREATGGAGSPCESLTLTWDAPQALRRVELFFDVDYDHPMETVQMGHPESAVPFCVKHYRLHDSAGNVLHECADNHQARNTITFAEPVNTKALTVEVLAMHGDCPAAIFEVRCYAD